MAAVAGTMVAAATVVLQELVQMVARIVEVALAAVAAAAVR